jgi:uncharacterized protein with GYD domain
MPTYICQGRYSREAYRGMLANPEDRATAVAKLFELVGGKLLAWYFTFGENDWLAIAEVPDEKSMGAAAIIAIAGGGVTDVKTTLALTSAEAVQAFTFAGEVGPSFKSAGQE